MCRMRGAGLCERVLTHGQSSAHEGLKLRAVLQQTRSENKLEDLVKPHAPADARVPAHRVSIIRVTMEQHARKRFRACLHEHFDAFEPQEDTPGGYTIRTQDLMFVVPAPRVWLKDSSLGDRLIKRRPAVRGRVK